MDLVPCTQCGRHHRDTETSCPFCKAPQATLARKAFHLVGGALTTVVLAACYGTGGFDDELDNDGDGYAEDVDCNDADFDVNPGATEVCDDLIDNNCDEQVDGADPACAETDP